MSKLNSKQKEELAFFINDDGKIQYNEKCQHCTNKCKQSFRAVIVRCPLYVDQRKIEKETK